VALATEEGVGWGRWLLARRDPATPGDLAYFLGCAPGTTALEALVAVAGGPRALDDCLAAARAAVGLGDYEVRHWRGWYRHVTLAMLAHAYRTVGGLPPTGRAPGA
jgi:SRSO17 transposase